MPEGVNNRMFDEHRASVNVRFPHPEAWRERKGGASEGGKEGAARGKMNIGEKQQMKSWGRVNKAPTNAAGAQIVATFVVCCRRVVVVFCLSMLLRCSTAVPRCH